MWYARTKMDVDNLLLEFAGYFKDIFYEDWHQGIPKKEISNSLTFVITFIEQLHHNFPNTIYPKRTYSPRTFERMRQARDSFLEALLYIAWTFSNIFDEKMEVEFPLVVPERPASFSTIDNCPYFGDLLEDQFNYVRGFLIETPTTNEECLSLAEPGCNAYEVGNDILYSTLNPQSQELKLMKAIFQGEEAFINCAKTMEILPQKTFPSIVDIRTILSYQPKRRMETNRELILQFANSFDDILKLHKNASQMLLRQIYNSLRFIATILHQLRYNYSTLEAGQFLAIMVYIATETNNTFAAKYHPQGKLSIHDAGNWILDPLLKAELAKVFSDQCKLLQSNI